MNVTCSRHVREGSSHVIRYITSLTSAVTSHSAHVTNPRAASSSSNWWKVRQTSDVYVKAAAAQNYRSRAAFKLVELDDKYKLLHHKIKRVVDLGAAPGAWSQVVTRRLGTSTDVVHGNNAHLGKKVISVDILDFPPVPGTYHMPHTNAEDILVIRKAMDKVWGEGTCAQLVLSDMLHSVAGQKDFDHVQSIRLCAAALKFCFENLQRGGNVAMKLYWGAEADRFILLLQKHFRNVTVFKAKASRKRSREVYIVGLGYIPKNKSAKKCEPDDFID